jgi:hypothetical protein
MNDQTVRGRQSRGRRFMTAVGVIAATVAGAAALVSNLDTIVQHARSTWSSLFQQEQPADLQAKLLKSGNPREKVKIASDFVISIFGKNSPLDVMKNAEDCRMLFRDDVFVIIFDGLPAKAVIGSTDRSIGENNGGPIVTDAWSDIDLFGAASKERYIVSYTEDGMGGGTGISRGQRTILPLDRQQRYSAFTFEYNFHYTPFLSEPSATIYFTTEAR